MLQWFQHRYDHFPLHQVSFKHIHAMTQAQLDTITNNDLFLIQQDECGLTQSQSSGRFTKNILQRQLRLLQMLKNDTLAYVFGNEGCVNINGICCHFKWK